MYLMKNIFENSKTKLDKMISIQIHIWTKVHETNTTIDNCDMECELFI